MLIGVLSDTHGDLHGTRRAVRIFESVGVQMLFHCGDVGTAEVISLLSPWPVHFVLGNVDRQSLFRDAVTQAGHVCHDRFGKITIEGRSIALLHGDDSRRLQNTIDSGQWDLVCHGHTHSPSKWRDINTLILNPGAISRTMQPSVAMVELPSIAATHVSLA